MKKILYKVITLIVLLTGLTNVVHATNYAVIINAESNGEHNHIRYWNDCSAVYQTLLSKGFSQDHIYVAMSDGTDSHDDIMLENSNYESSPLDLDGDSYYDIRFAATRDDIESIFYDTLSNKITEDDDLFIYTVGEGYVERLHFSYLNHPDPQYPLDPDSMSIYEPHYISSLVLWGEYHLMDISFARMLAHIQARTINIVM
ncbi:MAG: hypothetical protein IJQ32_05530 [Paludibacteraceae bacterium]|nr:hypothetical protein [Paludibacteraceae bacterium]